MLGSVDGKSNILCVTRITTIENWTFKIPPKYLDCQHHVDLIKTAAFAKVKNISLQRNQFRKNSQEKTEQINITKIAIDLVIEKYTGKTTNAEQWIASSEKECELLHIDRSDKKIELLKLCIENSATDWYSCTLLKLTADTEWTQWRDSFCNTFISKGWSSIKYAMQYEYISGSLLEYSIKKEKLLLQIRKTIDSDTLIDLIAMRLRNEIIEKIDREKLQRTEDLHNEIGKLEYLATKKNKDTKKTKVNTDNKKNKTPCKICKHKEKGTRFHYEDECWFKDQNKQGRREKNINNLALDVDLSTDDPKYLMCHH
ncbi:hypothetical protein HHI36_008177 [Cryptolaemus montrouzieri]|uniref:Uncharacterized protein n=1 Tax=Cryptolaemus montrouzieri TaxID=559131 RepID=A0ABD2MRS2_9CUCU